MEFIFWFCVLAIVWAYAGYPLSLLIIKSLFGSSSIEKSEGYEPPVTFIIAGANETKMVKEKIDNTLNLEYPDLEIILTLDGPPDDMLKEVNDVCKSYPDRITVLNNPKGGKESAQKVAIEHASGDILIFTDIGASLAPDTVKSFVADFSDSKIGAVSGTNKLAGNDGSGDGLYSKYENGIRRLESEINSLVGMVGMLFAVRREIVINTYPRKNATSIPGFATDLQSDFRTALITKIAGYKAVIDSNIIGYYRDVKSPTKEFGRKYRTVVRAIGVLFNHYYLLNPLKYGLFSYQLFNHKVMKWLVPFFMLGALISNIVLVSYGAWYLVLMLCQLSFYAIAGDVRQTLRQQGEPSGLGRIVYFFVMSNLAILKAWFSYAKGERFVMWEPSKR